MMQNVQPVALFLPLYDRTYVLRDGEKDIWLFGEILSNGVYPRYMLQGETLSRDERRHKAYLYGAFKSDAAKRMVSVLLEDMVTTKQGAHIGTWMLNRLIVLLRQTGRAIEFDQIYGDFVPKDEHLARAFFSRFNFRFERQTEINERIYCPVSEMRLVLEDAIEEISYREIVREWHVAQGNQADSPQ